MINATLNVYSLILINMNESTYSGIHSGHGCNVLRHSAPFKLRFINVVDLKDLAIAIHHSGRQKGRKIHLMF